MVAPNNKELCQTAMHKLANEPKLLSNLVDQLWTGGCLPTAEIKAALKMFIE